MNLTKPIFIFTVLVISLLLNACQPEPISFNEQVRSILNDNCLACHGGVKQAGGFSLLFREEALDTTDSGVYAIIPGDHTNSEMYKRLVHHDPEMRMPLEADPLSKEEIDLIARWIDEGAGWELPWAYRPVEAPELPDASDNWAANDIDRFVYRRLAETGLKPESSADPAVLLRRVSLDLTGLPPTIEELDAFLKDTEPGAYERAVDRLLASPRFGERWAAMWLDLARYADSKGYEKDAHRNIWRYRDWVIEAFNRDMPFDQFTIEQLAGDLLPNPSADQLIATAFHRNTMTNTEGGTDDEEFRVAAVIDRVNTTFEVWQATTISCVQCHSHPYDPIRMEEFYEVYAFFNNTVDSDNDADAPLLEAYEPAEADRVEAVIEYIQSLNPSIDMDQEALLSQKVEQALFPTLMVQDADDFENVVFYGREVVSNWSNAVKAGDGKRFFIKFEDIPARNLQGVTLQYRSDGPDSRFIVYAGKPDGKVLGAINPPSTKGRWGEVYLPLQAMKGQGDIVFELLNRTGRVPEGALYLRSLTLKYQAGSSNLRLAALRDSLRQLRRQADYTPVMQPKSEGMRRRTHVFERGNWLVHGQEVQPAVPGVFPPVEESGDPDRLRLARWLVSPDNPLTARVMVNRFWAELFGQGLVETLEDFGTQGERPSHPGLLDYLAWQFAHDYQWSVKELLRNIVLSATYRQSSRVSPEKQEQDPYNRLLARGPRFRLSAEQVRDQALAVSGLLRDSIGGPGVMPPQPDGVWQVVYNAQRWETKEEDRYRRGLYTYWKRTAPYPSMLAFDSPSREFCVSRRIRTNTPLQALVTLNDPVFLEAAKVLGERMEEEGGDGLEEQLRYGYRLATAQEPSEETLVTLRGLYQEAEQSLNAPRPETIAQTMTEEVAGIEEPMTLVASALLNLDVFLTKR